MGLKVLSDYQKFDDGVWHFDVIGLSFGRLVVGDMTIYFTLSFLGFALQIRRRK